MKPVLSFVLPCYGRPERTKRMLECISNQSINNWEGYIFGDCCPDFARLLESEWYRTWIDKETTKGNIVKTGNMLENGGGHGYTIINKAIQEAIGQYFMFLSNDDTIRYDHFDHYIKGIQQLNGLHQVDYDFIYFNTEVLANNGTRISNLSYGGCGHAELIIRTEFLKQMAPHGPNYGHDWSLIENMMNAPVCRFKKALSQESTYYIMSIPGKCFDIID